MRIAITCPVFITTQAHKDFLDLCTRSIKSLKHEIVFIPIENYVAPVFRPMDYAFTAGHEPSITSIEDGRQPQGVAKAWNDGIKKAAEFDCDYVIVINTDIVFKSNMIDQLVKGAESYNDGVMWTGAEYADHRGLEEAPEEDYVAEHPHFSCFMVKPDFFKHAGTFDENFLPAYCEDGDMHARLALANKKAYVFGAARFFHFGSRTIKSDQQLWIANGQSFPKNQTYFLQKWGHPVVGDTKQMREVYFKTPYNETDKPLSYWRGYEEEAKPDNDA